jgi:hypothetical protein
VLNLDETDEKLVFIKHLISLAFRYQSFRVSVLATFDAAMTLGSNVLTLFLIGLFSL